MQELPKILELAAGQGFSVTLLIIAVYWFNSELKSMKKEVKELTDERKNEYAGMIKAITLQAESNKDLKEAIEDLREQIKK